MVQVIIGAILLLLSIGMIIIDPSSISKLIEVNIEKQTFGGNLPAFLIAIAVSFLWFGTKKKDDVLEDAKKSLNDAADKISGKLGTIHVRIGPDALQNTFRQHVTAGTLQGKFRIRQRGKVLQNGEPNLYEDPMAKVLIAEIRDILIDQDSIIEITLTDGQTEWTASESIKVRIVNFS